MYLTVNWFQTMKIIISILTRSSPYNKYILDLLDYIKKQDLDIDVVVGVNQTDFYSGHQNNLKAYSLEDDDVIVFLHDDVKILSNVNDFCKYLSLCNTRDTGFLCLAGCTFLGYDGIWWNARSIGASRGFVFQGKNDISMSANPFGQHGQIICGDGCFLACSYRTLKKVGLEQPSYLKSGWDFYDIDLTFRAHLMGLNNYTVPIICRHESDGQMRKEWYDARQAFLRQYNQDIPCKLNHDKTGGLPL